MSLTKRNADRCLHLLWEYRSHAEAPEQRQAYEQAISSLHAYLTDVLPATLPCVRANAEHGVIELFQDEEARAQDVNLLLEEGDKLGVVLDKINVSEQCGGVSTASPIAIALIKPHCVAAKDNRLARGDQVIRINDHPLSQVSLQRARWLLDSAERSQEVRLSIIASGLTDGLKHSISRHDVNSSTPRASYHHQSRSRESLDKRRVQRLLTHKTEPSPKSVEKKAFQMQPMKPRSQSSLHSRPGFTPSQHGSDHSVVSSTVETAAHIARSSTRSSRTGATLGMPFKKRKVRKMHIMKGASGLGLRIIGGKGSSYGDMGIFVRQLEEGGAAFNDQRLYPGDELLMVDGKSLVGLSHDEAVAVLKATQKLVQLVVATEHAEGESQNSSVQSIPFFDRQVDGGQSYHMMTASEAPAVAPEHLKSPLRNTFENDEFEMKNLSVSAKHLSSGLAETMFQDENVKTIEIRRSEGQPLGFSIRQGNNLRMPTKRPICVDVIDPQGAAGRTNELHEGDQLLKVNEISLENCTREEALDVLTALKGEVVRLEVMVTKEKHILLHKIPGQPLGIQLTRAHAGAISVVTVKKIAVGSPAHTSGKLCAGDQLVSVNGISVFAMTVEQVKGLLASIPGGKIPLVVLDRSNAVQPDYDNLNSSLTSPDEKTKVEGCSDNVGTIELGREMDFATAALLEVPWSLPPPPPPPVVDSTLPVTGSISSKAEDADHSEEESDEDSLGHTPILSISQSARSRPESTIIELSGDFRQPEPLQYLASQDTAPIGQPPLLQVPSLQQADGEGVAEVLQLEGEGVSDGKGPQPPSGFLGLHFKIKKRPRGSLGVTLVASEGPTAGFFMVRRVTSNGVAAKDGRLQIGDRLVSVNGVSLFDMAHAAVLQTLNEARKELEVLVWRDPHFILASSSMHSLGSNLSGSHSSLLSEDLNEDGSPSLGAVKRRHTRGGLPSPASRDSPLAARFSYAGLTSSSPKELQADKRWSDGDVLAGFDPSGEHTLLQETTVPLGVLESAIIPDLPVSAKFSVAVDPPDLPEATLPDLPEATPPDLPEATPPDSIPPDLLEATPPDLATPPDSIPPDLPEATPPDLLEATPPDLPEATPPDLPEATPPDLPEATPPDLPEATPPDLPPPDLQLLEPTPLNATPSNLPEATPSDLPEATHTPEADAVSPNLPAADLPETAVPEAPTSLPPAEVLSEVTSILPEIPSAITPPESPKIQPSKVVPSSAPSLIPDIKGGKVVDNRPPSLQVPRGERTEKTPFEIEFKKGLFGIGVGLTVSEVGMLVINSLSARSIIAQDGNIKVGDILLSINDESVVGLSAQEAESYLKSIPRGPFRLTVMAPFKDVTGELPSHLADPPDVAPPASNIAAEASNAAAPEESIVEETLQHDSGSSLGFEIEGGSNTSLNYIYIKSLVHNSPAFNCGQFNAGDQLVMVGDTCLIGMSDEEATKALDLAPATVQVVAQRKALTDSNSPQLPQSLTDSRQSLPTHDQNGVDPGDDKTTAVNAIAITTPVSGDTNAAAESEVLESAGSTDDLLGSEDLQKRSTDNLHARKTRLLPEDRMTVELTRSPGKKLGIGIVGGIDNPNLRHIHVKQVISDGVAAQDGRIKRGDRIISVNGFSVTGLSNKQALQKLKEAGDHVTLVMSRKVGRRASRATTPSASAMVSGDASRTESRRVSPQRSPKTAHRKASSSDEGSREGSRGTSPQRARRHTRRKSVTAHGEVLTFTDHKSTLPRKIKGAKFGVQLVELHKGPTGLGMQIQGSADAQSQITVKAVLRGGSAFRSGKIHAGDEILEVNGTSFEKLSQQEAHKIMKELPQGKVSIILRDHKAILETED